MTLLDRIRERLETDLSDAELTAMIDAAEAEIVQRIGPIGEITVHHGDDRDIAGHKRFVHLARPADTAQAIAVVEIEPASSGSAENETTLAADDYRVLHGGRVLERLADGSNPRSFWAPLTKVTYTPVNDQARRDEAVIALVQLGVRGHGLKSERAGDWGATYSDDLTAERERILSALAPRPMTLA